MSVKPSQAHHENDPCKEPYRNGRSPAGKRWLRRGGSHARTLRLPPRLLMLLCRSLQQRHALPAGGCSTHVVETPAINWNVLGTVALTGRRRPRLDVRRRVTSELDLDVPPVAVEPGGLHEDQLGVHHRQIGRAHV